MQRKRPLQRKTRLKSGTTKLAKVNPARQAKRHSRQQRAYRAYRDSLCYLLVCDRSRGRCEYVDEAGVRCVATDRLEHHHKSYLRFGGRELPADIQVLCHDHHRYIERTLYPHRDKNRWRRSA
jgi:hypothetical protein